ncbi:hypothetical protein K466DRAFT_363101 [Polyporus arcularius HHB13444]|uniref:Uncharacterized protein n=1 Tax=Polyporus arcularius HHB13444 TaxID=1314778 RepID=A0A5C3PP39_9APHY|nr:hypothetical protein K466DRAFT_363101 [Polyporus arcularius HHB13444]
MDDTGCTAVLEFQDVAFQAVKRLRLCQPRSRLAHSLRVLSLLSTVVPAISIVDPVPSASTHFPTLGADLTSTECGRTCTTCIWQNAAAADPTEPSPRRTPSTSTGKASDKETAADNLSIRDACPFLPDRPGVPRRKGVFPSPCIVHGSWTDQAHV